MGWMRVLRQREATTGTPVPPNWAQDMIEFEHYDRWLKCLLWTPLVWLAANLVVILLFHGLLRDYPWFETNVEWLFHHPWSAT
jgi:uncharacterized membrane protein YbhN (UPF0104 family)